MNIGITNLSTTQASQGAARYNSVADTKAKASAPKEEVPEVPSVQPGMAAILREAALKQDEVRPEMIEKGSAFLADPNYPPIDVVNGISSVFVGDFLEKKNESASDN